MRSQLLTATALSTVLIALVPVTAEAQEAYNWTGFYFGGNLGVASQGGSTNLTYPAAGTVSTGSDFEFANGSLLFDGATTNGDGGPLPTLFSLNRLSGQVSVDAGYNLQRGNFVYGVEGEFGLLNGGTAHSSGMTPSGFTTVTTDTSLSSIMSLRARGGIAADRLLFFATAGLAAGQGSLPPASTSIRANTLHREAAVRQGCSQASSPAAASNTPPTITSRSRSRHFTTTSTLCRRRQRGQEARPSSEHPRHTRCSPILRPTIQVARSSKRA